MADSPSTFKRKLTFPNTFQHSAKHCDHLTNYKPPYLTMGIQQIDKHSYVSSNRKKTAHIILQLMQDLQFTLKAKGLHSTEQESLL